jgi:hypothetical protein
LLNELGDGEELERDLLASIQRVDPPGHAKAEAWARLSAQIGAVALVSTVHSSAAASAASSNAAASGAAVQGAKAAAGGGLKSALAPALLKVLSAKAIVGFALAGTAVGASAIWVHERAHHAAPVPIMAQTASPLSATPSADMNSALPTEPSNDDSAETPDLGASDTPPASTDNAARPSSEQRRRDQLSAESALLTQARAELRRGDVRGAQQLLRRLRVEFPKGVLGQEREVLAIEVLAASGNAAAAKRRAEKFIAAHPESPHSAQLSRFTDTP